MMTVILKGPQDPGVAKLQHLIGSLITPEPSNYLM